MAWGACVGAVEAVTTVGATACKAAHGVHQGVRTAEAEVLAGETAVVVGSAGAGVEDLGAETGTDHQCVAVHPHAVVLHGVAVAGVDHAAQVVDGPHQGGDHLDVPGKFFTPTTNL